MEIEPPDGPVLERAEPAAKYVTTLLVTGTPPITYNAAGNTRQSFLDWKAALDRGAADAAKRARAHTSERYSLRAELRLYAPWDQGSDLDNYVKPIQDSLAEAGVFGPITHPPMKGDERIDHVDLRRRRVGSEAEVGVLAEVWALKDGEAMGSKS